MSMPEGDAILPDEGLPDELDNDPGADDGEDDAGGD